MKVNPSLPKMPPEVDRPNIPDSNADDWVYLIREGWTHLLPAIVPYAAIVLSFVVALVALQIPEEEERRRNQGFSFAGALLAIGATALRVGGSEKAPESRLYTQPELRESPKYMLPMGMNAASETVDLTIPGNEDPVGAWEGEMVKEESEVDGVFAYEPPAYAAGGAAHAGE